MKNLDELMNSLHNRETILYKCPITGLHKVTSVKVNQSVFLWLTSIDSNKTERFGRRLDLDDVSNCYIKKEDNEEDGD